MLLCLPSKSSAQPLLSLLLSLRSMLAPAYALRYSCREGICGSCPVLASGTSALLCLSSMAAPTVLPLPHQLILRDLVVLSSPPYMPVLSAPGLVPAPLPSVRALLDSTYECILCTACSASCPSSWWHSSSYLGPVALLFLLRLLLLASQPYRPSSVASLCHSIAACTRHCPKRLAPSSAILLLAAIDKGLLSSLGSGPQ